MKYVCALFLAGWMIGSAHAEVVLDGSLGSSGSLTGPDFAITEDLGQQVGGNLFQSFESFNLSEGESATFSGPESVENIVARVTGGESSTIDGTIASTIDGANLWFLNPWGVMFGEHASLDITGSFYVSTADYLKLGDGGTFHATSPGESVLTSAAPEAFGFLSDTPAGITVEGADLENTAAVTLVGGAITLTDSVITAPGGIILVAAGSAGEITTVDTATGVLTLTNSTLDTSEADDTTTGAGAVTLGGGMVTLTNSDILAVTTNGDGQAITLVADTLSLGQGSSINTASWGSGDAGAITLTATNALEMESADADDNTLVYTYTLGSGDMGDLTLTADTLTLTGGVDVYSVNIGSGGGGDITLDIQGEIALTGTDNAGDGVLVMVYTYPLTNGVSGDLMVQGGSLLLGDGANLASATMGDGQGGDVIVDIAGAVTLSGTDSDGDGSFISASTFGSGDAGAITLTADTITMQDNAFISSYPAGTGDGGPVTLTARDITLSNASLSTYTTTSGNSGTITVTADTLTLGEGSSIYTYTRGTGDAGDILLDIAGAMVIQGEDSGDYTSNINTSTIDTTGPAGDAGDITVHAGTLSLLDGGWIAAVTLGSGDGGAITLTVDGDMVLSGRDQGGEPSGILSTSSGETALAGDAGNITITALSLTLTDGASLETAAVMADGGNITLYLRDMLHLEHGAISTLVQSGTGNGGNITIDPVFVVLNNSQIIANAYGGSGGNIDIVADYLITDPASVIEASSQLGIDGNVQIDAPVIDLAGGLENLSSNFLERLALGQTRCSTKGARSSLVVTGPDALPGGNAL